MTSATEVLESQQCLSAAFGSEHLLVHPDGQILDLATGYIPLLSTFTTEDKAAKGLRKGEEKLMQPIYFSLLDLLRDNQFMLLSGPSGSGKSTFAKHLCYSLTRNDAIDQDALISNGDCSASEQWSTRGLFPYYLAIQSSQDLETLARNTVPALLSHLQNTEIAGIVVVVDAVKVAGQRFAEYVGSIVAQFSSSSNKRNRLVLLGDTSASTGLIVAPEVMRYNIKPLSVTQRQQKISQLMHVQPQNIDYALGNAASCPVLFALALQTKTQGDQPEALLDAWLDAVAGSGASITCIEEAAFHKVCREIHYTPKPAPGSQSMMDELPSLARSLKVLHLLAARYLSHLPVYIAVRLFGHDPVATADIISSLLTRLHAASPPVFDQLAQALLQQEDTISQRATLLLAKAGSISVQLEEQIRGRALTIVREGRLPISERQDAASVLSRLGDPRDLAVLADVPASTFTLGSNTHPNSQPAHQLSISAFRIGMFPVTIRQYAAFAAASGRQWVSPDRHDLRKQNFPATDVTWHDTNAYCVWLTTHWRQNGVISEHEYCRLPSEPEWEAAASGGRYGPDLTHYLYPWGAEWHGESLNCDETGLNQPCAVGLFPNGVSIYGCHDMVGNVWECCSTLWGKDMATPSFSYPWQDDAREA